MATSLIWIVIVGGLAPQEEVDNAQRIADKLNSENKFAMVVTDDKMRLYPLHPLANYICLGGPAANKWSALYNDRMNPKGVYDENGMFQGYVKTVEGVVKTFPAADHGIISEMAKMRPRLKIVAVWGTVLKDTTSLANAYLKDEPPGVYHTPSSTTYALVGCEKA